MVDSTLKFNFTPLKRAALWVEEHRTGSEPGSPAGSPRGVVVATGFKVEGLSSIR